MRDLTLEQRERLARLCEVSAKQVPCQDDIRALLDVYEQQRAEVERYAWRLLKNVEDHLSEQLLRKEHGELRADFDRLCKERDELLVVVARARAALRGEGEK